jgi:hypothetical protein
MNPVGTSAHNLIKGGDEMPWVREEMCMGRCFAKERRVAEQTMERPGDLLAQFH